MDNKKHKPVYLKWKEDSSSQETDVSKKMKTYEVSVLTPYVTYTIKARTKKEAIEKCPTPDYIDFCDGPIRYVAEEIEEDEDAETET